MRVSCNSFDEFSTCLRSLSAVGEIVFKDTIRVSVSHRTLDTSGLKKEITFQASAIIYDGDENEYLLECGEICGTDYLDGHQVDMAASEKAAGYGQQLQEELGYRVLPGVISP